MSFEVALGTLGKALDQLSAMKPPTGLKLAKTKTNGHEAAATVAPKAAKKAPAKAAAKMAPAAAGKKAPKKAAAAAPTAKEAKAAKKPAAKPADGKVSAVAAGRRAVASGERPKLVDAMAIVMGDEKMDSSQVIEGLKAKGWEPNAKKLQSYISYMLSSHPDTFERVERGVYQRVKGGGTPTKTAAKAPKTAAKAPVTTKAPKKAAAKGTPQGKAVRVASTTQATDSTEPAKAEAAQEPVVASDPPPASDTDSVLARSGLNGDDPDAGNLFAEP